MTVGMNQRSDLLCLQTYFIDNAIFLGTPVFVVFLNFTFGILFFFSMVFFRNPLIFCKFFKLFWGVLYSQTRFSFQFPFIKSSVCKCHLLECLNFFWTPFHWALFRYGKKICWVLKIFFLWHSGNFFIRSTVPVFVLRIL